MNIGKKFDIRWILFGQNIMIDFYETCGYLAGILFASSLIPQIYKSCITKELDDISFGWQVIFILATTLGLIYSVHNDLRPVYLSSSVELGFMILLVLLKCYYHKSNQILDIKDIENP
jgi:uncharacterized protein with PQ loop repeat